MILYSSVGIHEQKKWRAVKVVTPAVLFPLLALTIVGQTIKDGIMMPSATLSPVLSLHASQLVRVLGKAP